MSFLYSLLWNSNRKKDEASSHILDSTDISVLKVDKEGNVQAKLIPNSSKKRDGYTSYYDEEPVKEEHQNDEIAISMRPKRDKYVPTYSREHIACQGNFTKLVKDGYVFTVTLLSDDIVNVFSTKAIDYDVKNCIVKIKDSEVLSEYDSAKGIVKLVDGHKYEYPLTINGVLSF